ncbi:Peroxiredoxin-5, mitochondrial [Erysiphe neolycopersici]|uniref:Peroxiredoxin-5, mitochondrial n=1 Tax=Erysiphe neolycopersici TaxID=212602 RepID=A0A420I1P3_9PEZI|nr:Peroxiredoxin-5, mitochondrial [Erysiphe neolycopersici]
MSSTALLRGLTNRCHFLQRSFNSSQNLLIKIGERIPDTNVLVEDSPGNKVNLRETIGDSKALVIGIPAAFSPSCSNFHIPNYIKHQKLKDAGKVFVISVNDPFVMKAWANSLDPTKSSGIRFLGDPTAKFTEALDLAFDGSAIFGGPRSKRYALQIDSGKIKALHVEPDNTGLDVSAAEKVLG